MSYFLGIPIEGKGLPFCFKINCSIRWILNICNKDSVDSNNCRYICSIKFKHVISDILLNLSTALTLVNELKALDLQIKSAVLVKQFF